MNPQVFYIAYFNRMKKRWWDQRSHNTGGDQGDTDLGFCHVKIIGYDCR